MQTTDDRVPGTIDAYYVFERLLDETKIRAIAERQREEAVSAAREAAKLLEKMGAELASERIVLGRLREEVGKLRCEVTARKNNEQETITKLETLDGAVRGFLRSPRKRVVKHRLGSVLADARHWLDARGATF